MEVEEMTRKQMIARIGELEARVLEAEELCRQYELEAMERITDEEED